MARLFACIISANIKQDSSALLSVAREFSCSIETLEDGILFDVSGLEKLIGDQDAIGAKIVEVLRQHNVAGSVAVAETIDSACLLARQNGGLPSTVHSAESFGRLPLSDLPIEQDTPVMRLNRRYTRWVLVITNSIWPLFTNCLQSVI